MLTIRTSSLEEAMQYFCKELVDGTFNYLSHKLGGRQTEKKDAMY